MGNGQKFVAGINSEILTASGQRMAFEFAAWNPSYTFAQFELLVYGGKVEKVESKVESYVFRQREKRLVVLARNES